MSLADHPLFGDGPTCRGCGCTPGHACYRPDVGACWWVEPDLCSHCDFAVAAAPRSRRAERLSDAVLVEIAAAALVVVLVVAAAAFVRWGLS